MVDHQQRAGKLWPVLVRVSQRRATITYGEAATAIGIHHRPIRYVLGEIQDYCLLEGLPPLTALVVSASTGQQGAGYLGVPGRQEDISAVWSFEWNSIANPFSEKALTEIEEEAELLIESPDAAVEVYNRVKARGDQQRVFRQALLMAYDASCAVCGLTFNEALEAAHIVPWSSATPALRVDPRNGLLLCANHHRLFDAGWINLLVNYEIEYSDPAREFEPYSAADTAQTLDVHGKRLKLPTDQKLWPTVELLRQRLAG